MTLTVALDFDSTIANILEPVLEVGNALYGTDFDVSDIDSWEFFPDGVPWTYAEFMLMLQLVHRSGQMEFIGDAKWVISEFMANPDIDVYVLTNNRKTKYITQWLEDHGLDIPVFSSDGGDKNSFGWDILVDDKPGLAAPPGRRIITFDQPYNSSTADWSDVYNEVMAVVGGAVAQ